MADKMYGLRLGEVLIKNGWITWEQLEKALSDQEQTNIKIDKALYDKGLVSKKEQQFLSLGEILIRNGWITWDDLIDALNVQRNSSKMIGEILIEKKLIATKDLYRGLAMQSSMVFVDFDKVTIPPPVLQILPKHLAYEYKIMPLVERSRVLLVAIGDSRDINRQSAIQSKLKSYEVQFALACPEELSVALMKYYGPEH